MPFNDYFQGLGSGNVGGTGLTSTQVGALGGLPSFQQFSQPLRTPAGNVPFGTVWERFMGIPGQNDQAIIPDNGGPTNSTYNPNDEAVINDDGSPTPPSALNLPTLPSMGPKGSSGGGGGAGASGGPKFNLTFSGPLDGQGTGPFGGSGQSPLGFLKGLFGNGQSGIVEPTSFPNPSDRWRPRINPNIPTEFRRTYRQPPNILDALRQLMMRGR